VAFIAIHGDPIKYRNMLTGQPHDMLLLMGMAASPVHSSCRPSSQCQPPCPASPRHVSFVDTKGRAHMLMGCGLLHCTIDAIGPFGAGDEGGNVFVWDPLLVAQSPTPTKDGVISPIATLKLHKGRILSICLAAGPDPLHPKARLATVSACNRIGIWDITCEKAWGNVKLVSQLKPKDITITGACTLNAGAFQAGAPTLLLSTAGPMVHGVSLADNTTHLVSDLFHNIPPRDKKKGAKLYGVAASSLHPHVAAAATNAGVAVLHSSATSSRAVVGLGRVAAFAPAGVNRVDLMQVSNAQDMCSASVVLVTGSKLVGATFEAVEEGEVGEDVAGSGTVAMPLAVRQRARCACVVTLHCLVTLR
jgi:hypothetical protein